MCPAFFFFNDTATTEIYTLSLHDALPILFVDDGSTDATAATLERLRTGAPDRVRVLRLPRNVGKGRSEEHTSELQSPCNLVCRLLLEKKTVLRRPSGCPPTRRGRSTLGAS